MAREVEFAVCGPAGEELGRFVLDSTSQCAALKVQIEQKVGPPPATQQIAIGDRMLQDVDPLLEAGSTADSVHVTLLLQFCEGESELEACWREPPGAGGFLEELQIMDSHRNVVLPERFVHACGLDPDSGLVLLMRQCTLGPAFKGFGIGRFAKGVPAETETAKDRASCLSESEEEEELFKGKGLLKGMLKGKPRRQSHPAPGSLIILPSEGKAVEVRLDVDHPLHWPAEILAAEAVQGFPIPSFGVAVARVFIGSKVHLISMELCPAVIKWHRLSESGTRCEAACLDRDSLRTIFVQAGPKARDVVFTHLRGDKAWERVDKFPLTADLSGKPVSSIAWSSTSSSLLLTFVGEHAIRVYQKVGSAWQAAMTLGDPSRRGCADGDADRLLFWFPKCDNLDGELTYSRPLVAGPSGAVFVHSGGVLMRLSGDLSSAIKVTSMREELWMLDDDDGPEEYPFPEPHNVLGVYKDMMYRSLRQIDYRGWLILRRLQVSPDLRQGRSRIRNAAPALWPSITENRIADAAFAPQNMYSEQALRPVRYYEEDRDKWDGNPQWLGDGWLWQKTEIPEDVRVTPLGRLIDFARWRQRQQWQEEVLGFKGYGKDTGGKGGDYQDPAKELGYKTRFEVECRKLSPSSV
ncbi:Rad54b [Symbiodinium microadriaticum]|nr:Rad54b [Symbiodinium microadriaticum]